jgi:hypothetical protein
MTERINISILIILYDMKKEKKSYRGKENKKVLLQKTKRFEMS